MPFLKKAETLETSNNQQWWQDLSGLSYINIIYLFIQLFIYLFIHLFIYLSSIKVFSKNGMHNSRYWAEWDKHSDGSSVKCQAWIALTDDVLLQTRSALAPTGSCFTQNSW